MTNLITPDIELLRQWLADMRITFFECDHCDELHLPELGDQQGVFDAKLVIREEVLLLTAVADVRPSSLLVLAADLSRINALSLTAKALLDIQDDSIPRLVLCQSMSIGPGIVKEQFIYFVLSAMQQLGLMMIEIEEGAHFIVEVIEEKEEEQWVISMPVLH